MMKILMMNLKSGYKKMITLNCPRGYHLNMNGSMYEYFEIDLLIGYKGLEMSLVLSTYQD